MWDLLCQLMVGYLFHFFGVGGESISVIVTCVGSVGDGVQSCFNLTSMAGRSSHTQLLGVVGPLGSALASVTMHK